MADQIAFQQYRRSQIAELRPWQPGDDMTNVSVSAEDRKAGSPKPGDMIARNPKNHADQWLVAAAYFADNFEPLAAHTSQGAVTITDEMVEAALTAFNASVNAPQMVPCPKCEGRGYHHGYGEDGADPDWCSECGGNQFNVVPGEEERAMRAALEAAARVAPEPVAKDWLDDFDGDKPIYTDRELIDLLGTLLQAQVREQRINSIEELHGMLRHIGRSQRAALASPSIASPGREEGWFHLQGDARLGRCATEGCGGQPTMRLEADGVGSDYCSGCAARIRALTGADSNA
jgi:predicted  nucleic acid-binding Zn-ribbon protein